MNVYSTWAEIILDIAEYQTEYLNNQNIRNSFRVNVLYATKKKFFWKATIEHEYVCSLSLLSWRENIEEFKQKVKIWSIAAEEQQPAGLWPRSPAASALQPLLQSRGLPGSGVPKHLLLLDRILIESCHTCHLSLRMITHLKGSFAGDTLRTFLARKCPSFYFIF